MMAGEKPTLFSNLTKVVLPLLLIPATFVFVLPYGHDAANLLVGAVLAYVFLFRADMRARRMMVFLSAFAFIFETANIGTGFYKYTGHALVPLWIGMGWAVLGWYAVSLMPIFKRIPDWAAYAANVLALLAVAAAYNFWPLSLLFAAVGVVLLARASVRVPAAFFAFASIMGLVLEASGTALGRWTYLSGQGLPTTPEFGQLALGYAMALAFCFWISGYDRLEEKA
jgi:hypothetical protein